MAVVKRMVMELSKSLNGKTPRQCFLMAFLSVLCALCGKIFAAVYGGLCRSVWRKMAVYVEIMAKFVGL